MVVTIQMYADVLPGGGKTGVHIQGGNTVTSTQSYKTGSLPQLIKQELKIT